MCRCWSFPLAGGRSSAAGLWSATLTRPHVRSLPQYFHITCFGGDKGARSSLYVCSVPQGESFLIKALSLWAPRVVYYSQGRTRRVVPRPHRWSVRLTFPWPCRNHTRQNDGVGMVVRANLFTASCRSMVWCWVATCFGFGYGFLWFCLLPFSILSLALKGKCAR